MWKVLKEHPQYFPPEKDIRGTFEWVWRVACTRLFAWEDGMLIPLADNLNHDDGYIRYESEYKCVLEEISKNNKGDTDYRDFSNESHPTFEFEKARFYRTRLQKYLDNSEENKKIEIDSIWELDEELKNYRSSSDEEDTRVIGELTSEEEDEYETSTDLEIRDEPDSYFILTTGVRTGFKKGEQVYNAYGRLSNRDLLLDYGFTLENNRYDALYFRIWNTRSTKTGLLLPDDYEQKQWKTDGHLIDDVSELYTLKRKKLNTQIFSYFRASTDFSAPELAGIDPPIYYGTPCLPKLEIYVIEKILALYSEIERYFTTPLEYDLQLLSTNLPIRERNAIIYRIGQKSIMENQKAMLEKLKKILEANDNGAPIYKHLVEKTNEELLSVYPFRYYLKSLKSNQISSLYPL
ncbi:unnamed protein product [Blepharisma stoltei]|uniref:Rubisco LSMT substrate-binding domain-containing protein n=1 Tax=Blepharisma stoltei TaxID=1481888 RepID=A0AAU9K8D9_9CILI|nr:unnamed protein product [Blepharisma stoltei]